MIAKPYLLQRSLALACGGWVVVVVGWWWVVVVSGEWWVVSAI